MKESPPRVVVDTNVLVSALLNPAGAPAQVLDVVVAGGALLHYDERILAEYANVLARPRFGFDAKDVAELLLALRIQGVPTAPAVLHCAWPDVDDAMFAEVAAGGRVDALVTGNLRHFPAEALAPVRVVAPGAWIAALRRLRGV